MKKLAVLGILMFSTGAFAASIACDVVETFGPDINGKPKAQYKYPVSAEVTAGDTSPQISIDSKYVKNVHIKVFACQRCSWADGQSLDEIDATLTYKKTGQSTNSVTMTDWLSSDFSVTRDNIVDVNCSLGSMKLN